MEASKRAYEKRKELDELQYQLRKIQTDKTLFEDEKQRQTEEVIQKIEKATSQE